MSTTRCSGLSGALGLAVSLCILSACGEQGAMKLSGCAVVQEFPSGGWRGDPYELHPFLTSVRFDQFASTACPVPILNAREQIDATGVLFSNQVFNPQTGQVTDFERARLRIYNAAGQTVGQDEQPFFAAGSVVSKELELFVRYPAVSGHGTFTEKDQMQVRISDHCCQLPQLRGEIELRIDYTRDQAAARVTTVGDEIPGANTSATYGALSRSAGQPHGYRWFRDGAPVGSGRTYTASVGTSDFDLRVDMSDSYGRTASSTLRVDVDGVRVESFTGPLEVWASAGGGTWTASGRGGSAPYEYAWYVNDRWVGDGASWSGYNVGHEGAFTLRVDVRNAQGATHSASREIMQMGTGSGGCDPPSGQDACATP
jgi:hypothetical protein